MDTREKIITADETAAGPDWAVAFGVFDVLTADHCRALSEAAASGRRVVALVAADEEGEDRLLDARSRAQLAAALGSVDRVVVCSAAERAALIERWRPALVVDVEAGVERDITADVLRRHGRSG